MRALLGSFALALALPAFADTHEAEGWRVTAHALPGKLGQHAAIDVVVESRAGYHLNDDYPLNFKTTANANVTFDSVRIDKAAAKLTPCDRPGKDGPHACRASVPVGFVAKQAGATTVEGTLSFSACDDAHCLIEKVPVTVDVTIR